MSAVALFANVAFTTVVRLSAPFRPVPPSAKRVLTKRNSPPVPGAIFKPSTLLPLNPTFFNKTFPPVSLLTCIPVPPSGFLLINVNPSINIGLLLAATSINKDVSAALVSCVVITVGWLKSCIPDSLYDPLIFKDSPYSVGPIDTVKAVPAETLGHEYSPAFI